MAFWNKNKSEEQNAPSVVDTLSSKEVDKVDPKTTYKLSAREQQEVSTLNYLAVFEEYTELDHSIIAPLGDLRKLSNSDECNDLYNAVVAFINYMDVKPPVNTSLNSRIFSAKEKMCLFSTALEEAERFHRLAIAPFTDQEILTRLKTYKRSEIPSKESQKNTAFVFYSLEHKTERLFIETWNMYSVLSNIRVSRLSADNLLRLSNWLLRYRVQISNLLTMRDNLAAASSRTPYVPTNFDALASDRSASLSREIVQLDVSQFEVQNRTLNEDLLHKVVSHYRVVKDSIESEIEVKKTSLKVELFTFKLGANYAKLISEDMRKTLDVMENSMRIVLSHKVHLTPYEDQVVAKIIKEYVPRGLEMLDFFGGESETFRNAEKGLIEQFALLRDKVQEIVDAKNNDMASEVADFAEYLNFAAEQGVFDTSGPVMQEAAPAEPAPAPAGTP